MSDQSKKCQLEICDTCIWNEDGLCKAWSLPDLDKKTCDDWDDSWYEKYTDTYPDDTDFQIKRWEENR